MPIMPKKLISDILSKILLLLFPRAERIGAPSKQNDCQHGQVTHALTQGRRRKETGQSEVTKTEPEYGATDDSFRKTEAGEKKVRIYKGNKELKVKESVYKMLGINDVNDFYSDKFICEHSLNIMKYDPSSKYDIAFFKQYWIYNNVHKGAMVLDIGCGSGALNILKCKDVHLVGIDLSEKALEQALLAGYDDVVMCDAFDTPFPSNYFDFIVSLDVLGHIENEIKDRYLDEWVRILKDDGVMLHGIECGDIDYTMLDEKTRNYVLIDGHVGMESFEKIEVRFRKYFTDVVGENFMGPCHNWYDIKKYDLTEELIGKEFRDYLMTFNPDQVRGFNSAMLLMRNLLLKNNLLGTSGGFMFIKARTKKI